MTIKRQHYVWRNYLRPWAPGDRIYCLRDGKIFQSDLMNIGQEKYFYKLKDLTDKEISIIRKLGIEGTPPVLQEVQENILLIFTAPFILKRKLQLEGGLTSEKQTEIDKMIIEQEEMYQGDIERAGIKHLKNILNKDISFYSDDDERSEFLYYLSVQFMRTKKSKANVLQATADQSFVDTEQIWNVLSHMYATSLGLNINRRAEYKLVLINNQTSLPFITGDQPVINTFAAGKPLLQEASDLELYYPVSPELAILITKEEKYNNLTQVEIACTEEVQKFNQYIIAESHEQLYSNLKEVLEDIKGSN